jgi:hypothetical protein
MKSLLKLVSDKDFINTRNGAFFNPNAKGKMALAPLLPFMVQTMRLETFQ